MQFQSNSQQGFCRNWQIHENKIVGGLTQPDLKSHYKALQYFLKDCFGHLHFHINVSIILSMSKTVCYWCKDRQIDQHNRKKPMITI